MHKTSINLSQDIFDKMVETAEKMDLSVSLLLKKVLFQFSKRFSELLEHTESSVSYQERSDGEWHVFPISYSDSEYEQCLDIRKVWKMSVSFFVSAAFLYFLNCPEDTEEGAALFSDCDSYMITDYCFRKEMINDELTITLIWGKGQRNPHLE